MGTAEERRAALAAVAALTAGCTRCPQLVASRSTVVFGAGHADADLMIVGEAPRVAEDSAGLPFAGQSGQLLDELLAGVGLRREAVFVTNVLRCRPPGDREPLSQEIQNCQDYTSRQVELVRPRVVCTLGAFATKVLRGGGGSIRELHGRDEVRQVGPRMVRLLPLFHPSAALYAPALLEVLREDFARLPALLALEPPAQPEALSPVTASPAAASSVPAPPADPDDDQLGLF